MFSQLGPLFKTTFRHAESTDTRQTIDHEDKKDGRRKHEDEAPDDTDTLWEDSTRVSVDALRTFLINFLNGTTIQTGMAAGLSAPGPAPAAAPPARPANPASARAAGAYQSMADKLEPHHYTPPAQDAPVDLPVDDSRPATDADLLHAAEIRLMHTLIADLEELAGRGVQELTIERADSFLEGLKNAVDAAKSMG